MAIDSRRRLVAHLKAMIACGAYREGDRLPTLRVFAEQFNTTLSTARNSVLELEKLGLLEVRRSDGVYVAANGNGNLNSPNRRIAVFGSCPNDISYQETYSAHSLLGLQEMASENNCRLEMHFRHYFQRQSIEITDDEVAGSDAIIFLGSYDWAPLKLPATLPAVGLTMSLPGNRQVSTVDLDPFDAAAIASEYFVARKIAKVKFFYLNFGSPRHRFTAFKDEFERAGGHCEGIIVDGNLVPSEFFDDPATGYLFANGTMSEAALIHYRNKHCRNLATDFTILSFDGKCRYVQSYAPVPNIGIDWREAGKALFSECMYRLDHPNSAARSLYFCPDLQLPGVPQR